MASHVGALARQMMVTALFDREINCRRAASAAFQENVGRQGHANFPHGIDILTAADYFTLGNRRSAYLNISVHVASFPGYGKALADHLVEVKLQHWDADLRALAAGSLAAIASRVDVMPSLKLLLPRTLSPNPFIRQGATLACAELTLALHRLSVQLPEDVLKDLRNTVPRVEKARLYRGRGGESMRAAACRLIECIALAGHPLTKRAQLRLMDTVEECMRHPKDEVKDRAIAALSAMASGYLDAGSDGLSDGLRLLRKYSKGLREDENPAARRVRTRAWRASQVFYRRGRRCAECACQRAKDASAEGRAGRGDAEELREEPRRPRWQDGTREGARRVRGASRGAQ